MSDANCEHDWERTGKQQCVVMGRSRCTKCGLIATLRHFVRRADTPPPEPRNRTTTRDRGAA